MAAIPFLNSENEDRDTRQIAFWSCVLITVGLAGLSVFGVWAIVGANPWGQVWRTAQVVGAELLAMVALMRALMSLTQKPKRWIAGILGIVVFGGLAWVCVQNAKQGAHATYPSWFEADQEQLRDMAALAGAQVGQIATDASAARDIQREDLRLLREKIASLKNEQGLMTARTPEGISAAQRLLQSKGLYDGRVDGKSENLTEAARREYGEKLQRQIETLETQEVAMAASIAGGVTALTNDRATSQISNEAAARKRAQRGWDLEVMLWTLEGARSLGLWVFVSGGLAIAVGSRVQKPAAPTLEDIAPIEIDLPDDLPQTEPDAPIVAVQHKNGIDHDPLPIMEEAPAIVETAPVVDMPIEEPIEALADDADEQTDAQRRAQLAGEAAAFARRAEQAGAAVPVDWEGPDEQDVLRAAE